MFKVKIAFYKADNPKAKMVDKIISIWTRGPYSHTELLIEKEHIDHIYPDLALEANVNRVKAYIKGLEEKPMLDDFKYYMFSSSGSYGGVRVMTHDVDHDQWDYITVPVNSISSIVEFFKTINGKKYDWLGILGFVIPIKDCTERWYCSESDSNALKISGCKKLWYREPSKIDPNKLYKILKGEI